MRLAVIVPAPWTTVSGGYVYDRAIVAAARASGHAVDVVEVAGRHPLPDDDSSRAARSAWQALAADAVPIIDGLCLPAFADIADALAARGAVALVHHPTALETGRDATTREQLRAIECAMLSRLRRVITTSPDTEQRLARDFGVPPDRIRVVIPGTPDLPRSLGPMATDGCPILAIGTLLPRKGHDVLLRAVARLPDLDWTLTIAGAPADPAYAQGLRDLAGTLGLDARVRLAGALTGDALDAAWRDAAVFALATHYEGYGMAVAEALRRGVPVAVTAGGALAELVVPEVGVLAEPGDAVALSNGLRRLVFDTELRRAVAQAAWERGRALPGWTQQAARFIEALQE